MSRAVRHAETSSRRSVHLSLVSQRACRALLVALLSSVVPAAHGQTAQADSTLTSLIALTSQRLGYAEPLARWQWAHGAASAGASDPAGATAQLAAAGARAIRDGLDPDYVNDFLSDQTTALRTLQDGWLAQWRSSAAPRGTVPDLSAARTRLAALARQMQAGLERAAGERDAPDCPARLARSLADWAALTRYDSRQADALDTALAHVCRAGGASMLG